MELKHAALKRIQKINEIFSKKKKNVDDCPKRKMLTISILNYMDKNWRLLSAKTLSAWGPTTDLLALCLGNPKWD